MSRNMFFTLKGNICSDRVRPGRALQNPPVTQEQLAQKIQLMGMDMTKAMISRTETNERHVCDAELKMIAEALHVSMEWLLGNDDIINLKNTGRFSNRR